MFARRTEVGAASAALTAPGSLGAVVTGPPGVGKSFLASGLTALWGADVHTVHVRGSETDDTTPYSGLGFLIARLPHGAVDSPEALLAHAADLMRADARGRRTVLVIETPGTLDEASVGVILHLMHSGTARALIVAAKSGDLPVDFLRLLRRGSLTEVPVAGISVPETKRLLVELLGSRVAAGTVGELHSACHGNPAALQDLAAEQRQSGNLRRTGDVWTMAGPVLSGRPHIYDDVLRAQWAGQTDEVRDVIELLAVARRVPLTDLAGLFGTDLIVDMEDSGLIVTDSGDRRRVVLRETRLAELVRRRLGAGRRRELYALLSISPGECGLLDDRDLVDYADWSLRCDGSLPADLLVDAARGAVSLFDAQHALHFTGLVPTDHPLWPAATRHRAAALAMLGRPEEALAALGEVSEDRLSGLDPLDAALHAAAVDSLARWLPDLPAGHGHLAEVGRRLAETRLPAGEAGGAAGASGSDGPETLAAAAEVLEQAVFARACFEGDYVTVIPGLTEAASRAGASPRFRRMCTVMLADALSACGREDEAEALIDSLGNPQDWVRGPDADALVIGAFTVWLWTGRWQRCVALIEDYIEQNPSRLAHRGGLVELGLGLAYTMAGRGDLAVDPLLAAAAQLEAVPTAHTLGTAYAAAAFAFAQLGDRAEAERYLALAAANGRPATWRLVWTAEFCSLMARRWLGDPEAPTLLRKLAATDEAAGRVSAACTALFGGSIPGSDAEFRWIESLARRRQGPLARLTAEAAQGARLRDAGLLLSAAELAHGMLLDAVEARCAALAVDCAREAGDAVRAGAAQARIDRLARVLPVLPITPQIPAPMLTEREHGVARLAANGASNREIAAAVGVSVRTVEGHLYQVFTKLGVSSRGGLAGLV